MIFPFEATGDLRGRFTLEQAKLWVLANRPTQIEMTDAQYFWLSELTRHCPRQFERVSIVFTDAPLPRV